MKAEQLELVERVFHAALRLAPEQRRGFVASQLPGAPELAREVQDLLAAAERGADFMETSLVDATSDAPAPLEFKPGRMIGPYRLIRELGRGGMGIVYEAEQSLPQRRVALKVIHGGLSSEGGAWRFTHEPTILARLNHPCIATIYDAGQTDDGLTYFAMELIAGERLDEYVVRHQLPRRQRLVLFCRICDGIQHAHTNLVIHLDLKPSNILVVPGADPKSDDLQVKVVDFGVAEITGSDTTAPLRVGVTGAMPGTLAYMSPEQRRGQRDAVDGRSDVYSLGVILFKLMTGELPYPVEGLPYPEACRVLSEELPRRPRTVDPGIPPDLDTIIRTAMAEEPARRYQTVAELAGDVRRFLQDLPIAARPPSKTYEWAKFAKRNKGLVTTLAAMIFGLTATIVGTSIGLIRARAAEAEAREQAAAAQFLTDLLATEFALRGELELEPNAGPQAQQMPLVLRRSALELKRTAAQRSLAEGRIAEAARDYDRLVRISKALFPSPNWYVGTLQAEYGECLLQLRRSDEAERQLLASYANFQGSLGDDHYATVEAVKRLARLYVVSGNPDKATPWTQLLPGSAGSPRTSSP